MEILWRIDNEKFDNDDPALLQTLRRVCRKNEIEQQLETQQN